MTQTIVWIRKNPAGRQAKNKARIQRYEDLVAHQAADPSEELHVLPLAAGRREQHHEDAHRVGIRGSEHDRLGSQRDAGKADFNF